MKFILILAGIILLIYDFGLGESKGFKERSDIRKKIGDYWVWAESTEWRGLARKDASIILSWFRLIFGQKILAVRAVSLAALFSILAFYILYGALGLYLGIPIYGLTASYSFIMTLFYIPQNTILDVLSLFATISILLLMTKSANTKLIAFYIVLDIFIVYVLAAITFSIGTSTVIGYLDYVAGLNLGIQVFDSLNILSQYVADSISEVRFGEVLDTVYRHIMSFTTFHSRILGSWRKLVDLSSGGGYEFVIISSEIILVIILTTAIPTILHIVILLIFLISKLVPKSIQRVIGRISQGFYESKMSPLKIAGTVLIFVGGFW